MASCAGSRFVVSRTSSRVRKAACFRLESRFSSPRVTPRRLHTAVDHGPSRRPLSLIGACAALAFATASTSSTDTSHSRPIRSSVRTKLGGGGGGGSGNGGRPLASIYSSREAAEEDVRELEAEANEDPYEVSTVSFSVGTSRLYNSQPLHSFSDFHWYTTRRTMDYGRYLFHSHRWSFRCCF